MSRTRSTVPPVDAIPTPPPESPSNPSPTSSTLFLTPASPPASPSPSSDPNSLPSEPSWPLPDDSASSDPAGGSGSSPRSTDRPKVSTKLRNSLRKLIRETTEELHTNLTAEGSLEESYGLFLADDDEVKSIADPAASLLSRRLPEGVAGNPDVMDGIQLAIAVARYVRRQMRTQRKLRQIRAQGMADPGAAADTGEAEDQ